MVVFTLKGKVVAKELFPVIDDSYYDIRFPPLFQFRPRESVDIEFLTSKKGLQDLNYSGDINDFGGNSITILYYELTPENDQLAAGCATIEIHTAAGSTVKENQCGLGFTNLGQVVLFNPKAYKNNHIHDSE